MEIKINDKPADITLENEKTAGEVIEGLLKWLEGSGESGGQYISGIEINGKSYGSLTLDEAFKFPLDTISSMNIKTSSRVELMLEALLGLKNDFELYESQTEEEQKKFKLLWEDSAPALFLKEHDRDLFKTAANILAACESSPSGLLQIVLLIKERIREIEDPALEIKTLYPLLEELAKRLEDMPLDMQTGKDSKAAETVTIFTSLLEKVFRLIHLLKYFGADIENIMIPSMNNAEKQKFGDFFGELSTALRELLSAFENKDTVLVGDIAEYEISPRVRSLAQVLNEINDPLTRIKPAG